LSAGRQHVRGETTTRVITDVILQIVLQSGKSDSFTVAEISVIGQTDRLTDGRTDEY